MSGQVFRDEEQILTRYTQKWFDETDANARYFGPMLFNKLASLSYDERNQPEDPIAYEKWVSAKAKHVGRVLNGSIRLPLAWKNVWLDLMPDVYSEPARREISRLYGVITVPLPRDDSSFSGASSLSSILQHTATTVAASAPAQDGILDENDHIDDLIKYRDAVADASGALMAELAVLNHVVADRVDGGQNNG